MQALAHADEIAFDVEAAALVIKPLAEFDARVRALLRRGQYQTQPQLAYAGLKMDSNAHQAWINDMPVEFTRREWTIAECLLLRAGQVLSKDKILESICTWDEAITPNAIEVYVSRLRSKLQPAGIQLRTIRGFGYLLEEAPYPEP